MRVPVVAGVVAFVLLGAGCEPGADDTDKAPARVPSPEALEACGARSGQPEAIESCLEVVDGIPDPVMRAR